MKESQKGAGAGGVGGTVGEEVLQAHSFIQFYLLGSYCMPGTGLPAVVTLGTNQIGSYLLGT
jgi:hypothetical protein